LKLLILQAAIKNPDSSGSQSICLFFLVSTAPALNVCANPVEAKQDEEF
jgi:hypothetical protein